MELYLMSLKEFISRHFKKKELKEGELAVTGDTHGDHDFYRFKVAKEMNVKTLIVCGDFGYIWSDINDNLKSIETISNIGIDDIMFIDGNHEDFVELNKFHVKRWNGGLVHELSSNIHHLIRGEVYNIKGKIIAVMGGAASTDKKYRIENITWWKEEIPSIKERVNLLRNLEACNWTVDIFLSHTPPSKVLREMKADYRIDEFTDFLDEIEEKLNYKKWYFGHMHREFFSKDTSLRGLYGDIEYI